MSDIEQIDVDHCQACGAAVADPDADYTDCCDEPVIPGSDDCDERCYHYGSHQPDIAAQAVAALRAFQPNQDQARRLLPMWVHYDKLAEAQRRQVLDHFDR